MAAISSFTAPHTGYTFTLNYDPVIATLCTCVEASTHLSGKVSLLFAISVKTPLKSEPNLCLPLSGETLVFVCLSRWRGHGPVCTAERGGSRLILDVIALCMTAKRGDEREGGLVRGGLCHL